jgi:NAD(P)-dependent dehydrogenase (short-subunit alcohol dehydrogenase family)
MSSREVVVITGATSGVGRALARRFASDRALVAILARGEEGLRGTVEDVENAGGSALAIPTDVADHEQVDQAARRVVEEWGGIDIWVNNAMTTIFAPFTEIMPEEFRRATEVTYLGVVWGTRTALDHMIPNNSGAIMQVGSALAYRGIPLQSPYCGAKHAIKGFTESLRSELLHYGHDIHLGMAQLPAVNTPQFSHCRSKFDRHPQPVPPIYQPEMAAEAIHLAVRERRRELYVAWPTVKTIVGNKLGSGFVDHYLAEKGVGSQLTDQPADPSNERGNLFEPVSGDRGAHGIFDERARSWSPQMWLNERRGLVALTLGGLLLFGWLASR